MFPFACVPCFLTSFVLIYSMVLSVKMMSKEVVWCLALDDRLETSLIEIMVCCVKQAATGEYPVGRGTTSRKVTNKETRQVAEDKAKLTEHFIVTLPQLLAKVN